MTARQQSCSQRAAGIGAAVERAEKKEPSRLRREAMQWSARLETGTPLHETKGHEDESQTSVIHVRGAGVGPVRISAAKA